MKKNINLIKNNLSTTFSLAALSLAVAVGSFTNIASAAGGATNPVSKVLLGCTTGSTPCGWIELVDLVNAVVQYGIEIIAIAFVLVLLYVGFMYLTSGGDVSKVKKARDMLNKVMWGMIFTLCAWIIVYFILTSLGVDKTFYSEIISN